MSSDPATAKNPPSEFSNPHDGALPPGWAAGAELKTYTGACHCRRFIFTFEHPLLEEKGATVMECNCSICRQKGLLYIFALEPSVKFTSESKLDDLSSYRFNKKHINQRFCPTCGCQIVAHADGMVGVNARAVDGLKFEDLERNKYDGAKI